MHHYKYICSLFLLFLYRTSLAQVAAASYWQQEVNYTIDVTLNDVEHTLDGFVRMQYSNHSPDTLSFIWIHCWPNAYKTDRTAFSDQLLTNGRTDFYFSEKEQRGYINHLDFRVDGQAARMEDHPQFIDIIRIWLPKPLLPGASIDISTPFHEQLPYNFSRGGHVGRSYQLTQWYPKPAVYDKTGWHEMPYLDQGEFYSEFGKYDVRITLPASYTVAAPGTLDPSSASALGALTLQSTQQSGASKPQSTQQQAALTSQSTPSQPSTASKQQHLRKPALTSQSHRPFAHKPAPKLQHAPPRKSTALTAQPAAAAPAATAKTLHYILEKAHDFAWFADTHFHVDHDTLTLPSGKTIDIYAYYLPTSSPSWQHSISFIKDAIRFRSAAIGEYPYTTASIVEAKTGTPGGMEYPAIASISPSQSQKSLDLLIEHELGHNWFQAALASNERRFPWMDEGLNTFYDKRYELWKYPPTHKKNNDWLIGKMPSDLDALQLNTLAAIKKDQPISSASEDFNSYNYNLIPYSKTALWLAAIQDSIGTPAFDHAMQEYYRRWQFRHPSPEDFRNALENNSAHDLSAQFAALDKKGPATPQAPHKKLRPTFLFNASHTDSISYINISPAIGYNKYDGAMPGLLIHNYDLPPNKFQFLLAPLYGTTTHKFEGLGRVSYSWYPDNRLNRIETGLAAAKFSSSSSADSNGAKLYGGFYKIAPFIRLNFTPPSPRSTLTRWIEWKTFFIGENAPGSYAISSADSSYYPTAVSKYNVRYINQLSGRIADSRIPYPYSAQLQLQQSDRWYRINFTGKYFFNYPEGGGLDIRLFAAKFGYLGGKGSNLDLSRYMPKLTGVSGAEDYTYSDYFPGRNQYTGLASQQIMIRDGGLKIRTPNFPWLEGRSDDWVSALNFNTSLPQAIIPSWLPLSIFFDIGTYSGAWKTDALTSHFLYTGGLRLSLWHDIIHFYAPLVYSSDFRDQLKTIPDQNTFWKKLSFSIDIQNFSLRKIMGNTPL